MSNEPNSNEPNTPTGDPTPDSEQNPAKTFTQADLDRIVQDRLAQQAKNKFGDYDELKTKAGASQSLEQRVAEMERETAAAKAEALRATVAAQFWISTKKGPKGEPSDADLFLTGSDEATLTTQAERLAGREAERKKLGNFAPKEGTNTSIGGDDEDLRGFARKLFNKE
jgi:hypothetical protein